MNFISNRAQNLYGRLWDEAYTDIEDKIIHFILVHAERMQGEKIMKIKMDDFARCVDDTRLNVSRVLNSLQEQKLLECIEKKLSFRMLHYWRNGMKKENKRAKKVASTFKS